LVMPFGVAGACGAIQVLMRHLLRDLENNSILIYLDDILVHAETKEKHDSLLDQVLS
ncbi:hypothetical protein L873DRAFT_1725534, partial [Choiromyces venosus 120613-1]